MAARREQTLERLFEVATLLTDALDRGLEQQGLSRARAEVLWRIHHLGPSTQRALAEALRCTPRNVTGLVDALQAQGLVERRPYPRDRRAVLVTLTRKGTQAVETWRAAYAARTAELLDGIDERDLKAFTDTLDHVAGRLAASDR